MENRLPFPRALPTLPTKVLAGLLGVALVVSGIAVYRYRAASTGGAPAYSTTRVQRGTITDAVTGTGPIAAAQAVPLNFKSSGKVAEIDVNVGDRVKAGQVLAKLDDADLKIQIQQAQANLSNAQSAYNKLTQGALPTDLAAAQAAVDAAGSQLASTRKGLAAAQDVAAKDRAAAEQALIDAQKNLQAVQAQIDASTAADKLAVANAQQALADAQRTAQAVPAVLAQQIAQAKAKLYADQTANDAAVGRGAMTKEQRQSALDVDQAAIDQANAAVQQQQAQAQQTLNQAQAALKTAQATLENDLAKFQGQLVGAQTGVNQAQSSLASTQAKDGQSVQSAQAQIDSAAAAIKTAQAAYDQKVAPTTQADIDAAQSQIATQQAGVQLAQNNLDAAVLTAPTDGTVTAINGAVGQWLSGGAINGSAASSASGASASAGSNFISLTSLNGLQVTAQVNESDIGRVQIGKAITFTVDAYPNRTFTGKVAIIQPLGQNVQNVVSYTVTSTIDQADAQLLPGMTATASIIVNQVRDALEVPMTALTFARGQLSSGDQARASGQPRSSAGNQGPASPGAASGGAQGESSQGHGGQGQDNRAQAGQNHGGPDGQSAGGHAAEAAGTGAAFEQPGGPGVLFLLKDGKLSPLRVQFGPSDGRFVQVISGASEGDSIIASGGSSAPSEQQRQGQPQAESQGHGGPPGLFGAGGLH